MRQRILYVLTFGVLVALAGCDNNNSAGVANKTSTSDSSARLTDAKAQKAIQAWISRTKSGGSVSVLGLQELPQQNSAKADLQFTNLQYRDQVSGEQNVSCKGVAIFSHYSDGRWVLTEIATDNGLHSFSKKSNIEAN